MNAIPRVPSPIVSQLIPNEYEASGNSLPGRIDDKKCYDLPQKQFPKREIIYCDAYDKSRGHRNTKNDPNRGIEPAPSRKTERPPWPLSWLREIIAIIFFQETDLRLI